MTVFTVVFVFIGRAEITGITLPVTGLTMGFTTGFTTLSLTTFLGVTAGAIIMGRTGAGGCTNCGGGVATGRPGGSGGGGVGCAICGAGIGIVDGGAEIVVVVLVAGVGDVADMPDVGTVAIDVVVVVAGAGDIADRVDAGAVDVVVVVAGDVDDMLDVGVDDVDVVVVVAGAGEEADMVDVGVDEDDVVVVEVDCTGGVAGAEAEEFLSGIPIKPSYAAYAPFIMMAIARVANPSSNLFISKTSEKCLFILLYLINTGG